MPHFRQVLLGAVVSVVVGCGGGGGGDGGPPTITAVVLSGDSTVVLAGTRQLTATAMAGGTPISTGITFQWTSSDTTRARASQTGLVTGVRLGSTNITALAVVNGTPTAVSSSAHAVRTRIGTIVFTPAAPAFASLHDTVLVSADARDALNASIPGVTFTWLSRNGAVATAVDSGTHRAIVASQTNGTARIVATGDGVSDSVTATVQQIATTLSITPDADTLHSIGATLTPLVTAHDANGNPIATSALGWSSQNTTAVTVSITTGVMTAVNNGDSRVIATSGSLADTIAVTVDQVPATLTIVPANLGTPNVQMRISQSAPFWVQIRDSLNHIDARSYTVNWSGSSGLTLTLTGATSPTLNTITTGGSARQDTLTAQISTTVTVTGTRLIDVVTTGVSLVTNVQTLFTGSCTGCHAGAGAPQGMRLTAGQTFGDVVDHAAGEVPSLKRVRPFRPDSSYLVHKVQGTQATVGGSGSQMPLGQGPLSNANINIIRNWILQGALNN